MHFGYDENDNNNMSNETKCQLQHQQQEEPHAQTSTSPSTTPITMLTSTIAWWIPCVERARRAHSLTLDVVSHFIGSRSESCHNISIVIHARTSLSRLSSSTSFCLTCFLLPPPALRAAPRARQPEWQESPCSTPNKGGTTPTTSPPPSYKAHKNAAVSGLQLAPTLWESALLPLSGLLKCCAVLTAHLAPAATPGSRRWPAEHRVAILFSSLRLSWALKAIRSISFTKTNRAPASANLSGGSLLWEPPDSEPALRSRQSSLWVAQSGRRLGWNSPPTFWLQPGLRLDLDGAGLEMADHHFCDGNVTETFSQTCPVNRAPGTECAGEPQSSWWECQRWKNLSCSWNLALWDCLLFPTLLREIAHIQSALRKQASGSSGEFLDVFWRHSSLVPHLCLPVMYVDVGVDAELFLSRNALTPSWEIRTPNTRHPSTRTRSHSPSTVHELAPEISAAPGQKARASMDHPAPPPLLGSSWVTTCRPSKKKVEGIP